MLFCSFLAGVKPNMPCTWCPSGPSPGAVCGLPGFPAQPLGHLPSPFQEGIILLLVPRYWWFSAQREILWLHPSLILFCVIIQSNWWGVVRVGMVSLGFRLL